MIPLLNLFEIQSSYQMVSHPPPPSSKTSFHNSSNKKSIYFFTLLLFVILLIITAFFSQFQVNGWLYLMEMVRLVDAGSIPD